MAIVATQSCQAQQWPDEHTNGPFVYHADFTLDAYETLLQGISELQHDVPRQLGIGGVDEPIHIFLFRHSKTYHDYLKKYFPTVPTRPALFIKQRGPGMVFTKLGANMATDLRHETTHAVLHSALPMVPLWLDEGLAEYFELPAATRSWNHTHHASIRSQVRWRKVPKLERLEAIRELSDMHSEHYRDAWAWVHFMLHGPSQARVVLQGFLRDIEAHAPPGQLSKRLRRNVPRLESQYIEHFRSWRAR